MSKIRYFFDEKTATYQPEKRNKKKLFLWGSIAVVALTGVGITAGVLIPKNPNAQDYQNQKELLQVENQYIKLQNELAELESSLDKVQEKDENIYRTFFQMDTLSDDERKGGFGGVDRYANFRDGDIGDLVANVSQQADVLRERLKIQEKSLASIKDKANSKSKYFLHIPAIQPITNKDLTRIASGFGMRRHPILGVSKMHDGIDFTAPTGTPIYATANGTVSHAGGKGGYGNTVVIDHGNGYETMYAHMSRLNTRAGAKVARGQIIGYVGSTGLSSGPHLHYELKKDGEKINPISYFYQDLNAEQYKKLKEYSEMSETSWD